MLYFSLLLLIGLAGYFLFPSRRKFFFYLAAISFVLTGFGLSFATGFLFLGMLCLLPLAKKSPRRRKKGRRQKRWSLIFAVLSFILFAALSNQAVPEPDSSQVLPSQSRAPQKQQASSDHQASTRQKVTKEAGLSQSHPSISHQEAMNDEVIDEQADAAIIEKREAQYQQVPNFGDTDKYVTINDNVPYFTSREKAEITPFEEYSKLDYYGRVGPAEAILAVELMPDKERESIQHIYPTGWQQRRYTNINGGWLYNRSHLIGFQLAGENANPKNLMTGTRYFNAEGMLPFENYVADYIERTEKLVRYRITPVFIGREMLARGVYMEAYSIEDGGKAISMNVFIPNHQPGITIDYRTGESVGPMGPQVEQPLKRLRE